MLVKTVAYIYTYKILLVGNLKDTNLKIEYKDQEIHIFIDSFMDLQKLVDVGVISKYDSVDMFMEKINKIVFINLIK